MTMTADSGLYYKKEIVDVEKCDEDELVFSKDEHSFQASFFNIRFVDENARLKACGLLEKAHQVEVEIDPQSSHAQPIDLYIFTDGYLLQRELIEKGLAKINIRNPEYIYETDMAEAMAVTVPVIADSHVFVDHHQFDLFYLPTILFILFILRKCMKRI